MRTTLLDFRIEGKTPCEKERLISSDKWFEISLPSFRGLRDKIIFLISILSTGFMKKESISISGRKSWNLFLENLTVDWIELEIFINYLLNALAMSLCLVNVTLFSTTAKGTEFEVIFRDISFLLSFQVFLNH